MAMVMVIKTLANIVCMAIELDSTRRSLFCWLFTDPTDGVKCERVPVGAWLCRKQQSLQVSMPWYGSRPEHGEARRIVIKCKRIYTNDLHNEYVPSPQRQCLQLYY